MSETIENTADDAEAVTTPDSQFQELIENLKKDNYKQRQELKSLKTAMEELSNAKSKLEEEKNEWEQQIAETKLKNRQHLIQSELDRVSITEESARKLAIKMLDDSEDIQEGINRVIEEYPFLVGKSRVVIPDTGSAKAQAVAVPNESKLSAGLSKLIKQ